MKISDSTKQWPALGKLRASNRISTKLVTAFTALLLAIVLIVVVQTTGQSNDLVRTSVLRAEPLYPDTTLPLANARSAKPRLKLNTVSRLQSTDEQLRMISGRSFFEDPWVIAGASTTLRDGLGPLYSARSCNTCHQSGGRSNIELPSQFQPVKVSDLSLHFDNPTANQPSQALGKTWQPFAVPIIRQGANVGIEGIFEARFDFREWHYPDGATTQLQIPVYRLTGAPNRPTSISPRIAPSLDLAARIDSVATSAITDLADPDDRNYDGISGRVHPNVASIGDNLVGRFGLKAVHPRLSDQVAAALSEDLGITSVRFPKETCSSPQLNCLKAPNGRGSTVGGLSSSDPQAIYEINEERLTRITNFVAQMDTKSQHIDQSKTAIALTKESTGKRLFKSTGCAQCHMPLLTSNTSKPVVLFSDLLLHDMGPALADQSDSNDILNREWRTAPLANLSLRPQLSAEENYLHDGRAKTIEQAILWHGGEATSARQEFENLKADKRKALLRYLGLL